ncbi:MAG: cyclodehydratase [Acidimicrobiales bacterium]|nr:cyclodehydratase [Acidimicrobiales bacterium]
MVDQARVTCGLVLSTLASTLGFALTPVAATATPPAVGVGLQCRITGAIQKEFNSLRADLVVDAPAGVAVGAAFQEKIAIKPIGVPATQDGVKITHIRDVVVKLQVGSGATITHVSAGDWGGASVSTSGAVITLRVPAPVRGGSSIVLPEITVDAKANGADGSVVTTTVPGASYQDPSITLTVRAAVGSGLDLPTACYGAPPNAEVASVAIGTGPVTGRTTNERFVRALYRAFVGRVPTAAELRSEAGTLDARTTTRLRIAERLSMSDAWLRSFIERSYRETLHRAPDGPGLAHWVSRAKSGVPMAALRAAVDASPELFAKGAAAHLDAWVTLLYTDQLKRRPDAGAVGRWVAKAAAQGRFRTARDFGNTPEARRLRIVELSRTLLGAPLSGALLKELVAALSSGADVAVSAQLAATDAFYTHAQTL